MSDDILAKLEKGVKYRTIDGVDVAYSDDGPFEDLMAEAAAEIRHLRSLAGAVSQGSGDFRTIARDLPCNEPKQPKAGDD